MADAQKVIEIVLNAKDNTGDAFGKIGSGVANLNNSLNSATQPLADFTKSALAVEAGILAAGAALTAFAINEAAEFESAVAELSKVLGETDNIDDFKNLAFELSESYGVASGDVLESVANFKQAGFTAEEAGILTRNALDLVIAGSLEASFASEKLVGSLRGFGLEAADAASLVDLLNEVQNNFNADQETLLENFSKFAPIAQTAGLSLEETVGVLTSVAEVFGDSSEAANGLKTVFLRLQSDTGDVTDALKTLGVSQTDVNGQLKTSGQIYFEVANAFQGLNDSQASYLAGQLAGINQAPKFLQAVQNIDVANTIAGESFEYAGSAAKEVANILDTTATKVNVLGAALNNSLIKAGDPLLESFGGVAEALTSVFQVLGDQADNPAFAGIYDIIIGNFNELEDTLLRVAENLPAALDQADFSGFVRGVEAVGDAFGVLFEDYDLSSAEGLADLFTTLGLAFEGLSEFSAGAIESFKPIIDFLVDVGREGANSDKEIFKLAGTIGGWATQVNQITGALNTLAPVLTAVFGAAAVGQIVSGVGSLARVMTTVLVPALAGPAGVVAAAGAAGVAVGALVGDAINDASDGRWGAFWLGLAEDIGLVEDPIKKAQESLGLYDVGLQEIVVTAERIDPTLNKAAESFKNIDLVLDPDSPLSYAEQLDNIEGSVQAAGEAAGLAAGPWAVLAAEQEWAARKAAEAEGANSSFFSVVSSGTKELSKTKDALKAINDESAKLAIEEKIALIESQAEITAASIEAQADKISSAFDSITGSVGSTGDAISDLYGLLGDDSISKFDKLDIKAQIEEEQEAREKLLELQLKLTAATLKETEARISALEGGGALINIQGDGLEPHLEAFMFEILKAIQVRASAEGYDLLLGAAQAGNQ